MDMTAVTVATVGAGGLVLSAWLARPTVNTHLAVRRTQRAVAEVQSEFRNNGGSTAKDQLDRIERGVVHLTGRFDQHLADSTNEKDAAHREAIRMWSAIEAVAHAQPPQGDRHG